MAAPTVLQSTPFSRLACDAGSSTCPRDRGTRKRLCRGSASLYSLLPTSSDEVRPSPSRAPNVLPWFAPPREIYAPERKRSHFPPARAPPPGCLVTTGHRTSSPPCASCSAISFYV